MGAILYVHCAASRDLRLETDWRIVLTKCGFDNTIQPNCSRFLIHLLVNPWAGLKFNFKCWVLFRRRVCTGKVLTSTQKRRVRQISWMLESTLSSTGSGSRQGARLTGENCLQLLPNPVRRDPVLSLSLLPTNNQTVKPEQPACLIQPQWQCFWIVISLWKGEVTFRLGHAMIFYILFVDTILSLAVITSKEP